MVCVCVGRGMAMGGIGDGGGMTNGKNIMGGMVKIDVGGKWLWAKALVTCMLIVIPACHY